MTGIKCIFAIYTTGTFTLFVFLVKCQRPPTWNGTATTLKVSLCHHTFPNSNSSSAKPSDAKLPYNPRKMLLSSQFLPPSQMLFRRNKSNGEGIFTFYSEHAKEILTDFKEAKAALKAGGKLKEQSSSLRRRNPLSFLFRFRNWREIRTLRNERMKNHLSWVFRRQASASGQDPTSTSGDKTNGGLVGQKESDEKKRRGRRKVRSREPSMRRDFEERRVTFWLQRCWRRALVWWRASRAERR